MQKKYKQVNSKARKEEIETSTSNEFSTKNTDESVGDFLDDEFDEDDNSNNLAPKTLLDSDSVHVGVFAMIKMKTNSFFA